ncbi:MAG: enoyl-CoA hydratase-related protein [bacterium]|nr:enoyl-CoA hydratase-related protein [bacterium]
MEEKTIFLRPSALAELYGSYADDHGTSIFNRFFNPEASLDTESAIANIFGPRDKRKSLLVAGATGIVGFGKTLQFASRLFRHGVKVVAIDLPGMRFDAGAAEKLLSAKFTGVEVKEIMSNIVFLHTGSDGKITEEIGRENAAVVFEAIPEKKELKQKFFEDARSHWQRAILLSATSGFEAKVLFDGIEGRELCTIAHPAFPHLTNKWFEVVGSGSGAPVGELVFRKIADLFLALGLIPKRVGDVPSFVLDRIFCGLFNFCLMFGEKTKLAPQQIDNTARKVFGPRVSPFLSHDYISGEKFGAANALTLSCLSGLEGHYGGGLFSPHKELSKAVRMRAGGKNKFVWHGELPACIAPREKDEELFRVYALGGLAVVVSQILHEKIAGTETVNGITEGCALFSKGILNMFRALGKKEVCRLALEFVGEAGVEPSLFRPEAFEDMENWKFYVNAEIVEKAGSRFGVITMSRDSYSWVLDKELNEAMDFLLERKVRRVVIFPDMATSTQFGVGADTTEFMSLTKTEDGVNISKRWSETAWRLRKDFNRSVSIVKGKAWGGMLELALHCHYVLAEKDASLRFPEVTLKIVPGMGGLHVPFRRVGKKNERWAFELLMNGEAVSGKEAAERGLVNFSGEWEEITGNILGFLISEKRGPNEAVFVEKGVVLDDIKLDGLPDTRIGERGFMQPYSPDCRKAIFGGITKTCSLPSFTLAVEAQARASGEAMFAPWGFLGKKR